MTAQPDASVVSEVEADLLAAIVRDLHMHSVFQPLVDLRDGSVVGYEALARGPLGPLSTIRSQRRHRVENARLPAFATALFPRSDDLSRDT